MHKVVLMYKYTYHSPNYGTTIDIQLHVYRSAVVSETITKYNYVSCPRVPFNTVYGAWGQKGRNKQIR